MTGPGPIESTAVGKNPAQLNERTHKLVLTGLMAALCYVAFTFLKIPVPTPGGGMVALPCRRPLILMKKTTQQKTE